MEKPSDWFKIEDYKKIIDDAVTWGSSFIFIIITTTLIL